MIPVEISWLKEHFHHQCLGVSIEIPGYEGHHGLGVACVTEEGFTLFEAGVPRAIWRWDDGVYPAVESSGDHLVSLVQDGLIVAMLSELWVDGEFQEWTEAPPENRMGSPMVVMNWCARRIAQETEAEAAAMDPDTCADGEPHRWKPTGLGSVCECQRCGALSAGAATG